MSSFPQTSWKNKLARPLLAAVIAIAFALSLGAYEFIKPVSAKAAATMMAAPAAALDDNSVTALLSLDHAMETLAARVTPAIVNVAVTSQTRQDAGNEIPEDMQQFFGQQFGGQFGGHRQLQPQIEHGIGSGVVISPDGYIVTNNHVIDGAVDIRVTMTDKRILKAKLIGADKLTDLAVLKVEGGNLPSVPWGDSAVLRPGQTVLAFGNPYGFRFTVTRGIVSALNRPNPFSDDRRKPGEFIQTDAAINPGNSGGPLVNAHGEVVGINTFLVSPSGTFSGMGFAIPAQIVRPTVETLIRDGKVTHGYIGIGISDVTPENSKFFDMKESTGALVSQVEANSPGGKAGLKVGDVIVKLNGETVNDAGQLQMEVGQRRPGSTITLAVLRDGKSLELSLTLEEMGSREGNGNGSSDADHGKPRWGIGLADLTPDAREQLQAPREVQGALIESVQPGSAADNAGLERGEVIEQVDRHDVRSAADVQKALSDIPKGQDALLLIWSNGGSTFRVLHAGDGA